MGTEIPHREQAPRCWLPGNHIFQEAVLTRKREDILCEPREQRLRKEKENCKMRFNTQNNQIHFNLIQEQKEAETWRVQNNK